ncbi:MAG: gfo/Idh/MocA family oxidoreductase, partial [Thermoguttaceae bacterium]|nr:gfo/Idh/MocA family oxidoreductase [Thermoguttaceae bacterium]
DDLFAALLAGQPYNEADWGAEASMTAILGRMATYSGQTVRWDDAIRSQLDLAPETLAWDAKPKPAPGPDGLYPCAIPGVTKAW